MESIKLKFEGREGFINITETVQDYVTRHRIKDGMIMLGTPELTCSLTIADADNEKIGNEFLNHVEKIIPQFDGMQFKGWAIPGLKASLIGQTITLMIADGCLLLGLHQGIFAVDFTGYAADFSCLDERYFFINHIGTTLAEGEEPVMPEALKERNDAIREEEQRKAEEEARIVEEMRQEAIERQRKADEERKAGKKKKYETPAWMRKQIDEGKL